MRDLIVFYSSKSLQLRNGYILLIISADKAQSPDNKKLIILELGQWKNLETSETIRAWKSTRCACKDESLIDQWVPCLKGYRERLIQSSEMK